MNNIEKQIEILKESPLFNLSLTSKELFHSNFLAWIINNYKEECADIFSPFIDEKTEDVVINKVTREEKNRDLIIYFNVKEKKKRLIIENKVKSLPYREQLEKYSEGADSGDYFILLSIVKPVFMEDEKICINDVLWRYLSYIDLSKILVKLNDKIKDKNNYHSELLQDYIIFINSLSELFADFDVDWENDYYNFSDKTDKSISLLKSIRMHDIYLKYKCYLISARVLDVLKREFPQYKINLNKKWTETKVNEIVINYGMANATGLFDVKYTIDKYKNERPLVLGLQFQGDQFRLFVETEEIGMAERVSKILYSNKLWFNFSLVDDDNRKEYPLDKDKTFNKFGNTFYYRSIKVNERKISDIILIIEKYVKYIVEECSIIKKELPKI